MTADKDRRDRQEGAQGGQAAPSRGAGVPPRPGAPRPGPSRVVRKALRRGPAYEKPRLVLGAVNYALLGAGLLCAIVGFLLLAARDISLAPLLIVLGYCVLVPAGLLVERVPGAPQAGAPGGSSKGE